MLTKKIAIVVQHLLGAGHLVRAMSLAESLSQTGHQVLLLSGGFPIDRAVIGYRFFQLPETRAIDGDFTRLVDHHNQAISDAWRKKRAGILLAEIQQFEPDLVITETFPFGRRQFRFELEPLLDWIQNQKSVRLMASIRDILQRRSDAKNRITVETIEQYYDAVLIHADQNLFALDASFPLAGEIEHKLIYTGYIHQKTQPSVAEHSNDGWDEIIVSGGSGTVSQRLIETARLARPLSSAKSKLWRLLTGRESVSRVETAEPGLIIEANRPDFYQLLSRCSLSISQAGYNTALDVLSSGARSVMVPFEGDGETEQNDRAQALERAGRIVQLSESALTPKNLAQAIDQALAMAPANVELNFDGAAKTAELINQKFIKWNH